MEGDGFETVYHRKENECLFGKHDFTPLIEGDQTVGIVCTLCGKSVREDMTYSDFVVTEKGLERNVSPPIIKRRDPRF